MHQPIYFPYESVTTTNSSGAYSFDLIDVHNDRVGPYTSWPMDAVLAGISLGHLGAQVSFSGSLMENLETLESAGVGGGMWSNWSSDYEAGAALITTMGNPRLDMVAFGYHHPLLPLLDSRDRRMQIQLHKHVHGPRWSAAYSRGMFPPETAFHTRIIPDLVAEGIEWVLIDNIHFDRACVGYPHTNASNLSAPNPADQVNPDPVDSGGAWVQLQNLWAPSRVSAPFGYQPHHVQHVDPVSGQVASMIGVPAARYEGNEDGRGGYGAFLYDQVMDALIPFNTDASAPLFVVLHHDGDNFGGGSDAYYHANFQAMVNWASADADYDVTTVQDYLDRFPPDLADVIHVEPGSWAGADNGDPEFKKWLGDPDGTGWSPDRNSWAVLTATKNHVFMADDLEPHTSMAGVLDASGSDTDRAWHYLLCAQASDYWYWDGTEVWDSNVTRGCNLAATEADIVLARHAGADPTAPNVFLPQREPYNPGGFEWGATPEDSDFEVWTYAYDVSGLARVELKWRVDADGQNPLATTENETYAGGPGVSAWNTVTMTSSDVPPPSGILTPSYRAMRYGAMVTGQTDVLLDYYVEAEDTAGNVSRSDIQHVYVGVLGGGGGGGSSVTIAPDPPAAGAPVTVTYDPGGGPLASAAQVYLHYGFDNWASVAGPDPAMTRDGSVWSTTVGVAASASQLDLVFTDGAGVWDNNSGQDWHFVVEGAAGPTFVLDGVLDADVFEIASSSGGTMHAAVDEHGVLYVAAPDAGEGNDHFIFVAQTPGAIGGAPWAKSGQVASWSAFLADENDNDYEGWFDEGGLGAAATGANGGVLEGTLDLDALFGDVPQSIWLAFAPYASADAGSLDAASQIPISDGDGHIQAAEYIEVQVSSITLGCDLEGDVDGNESVDVGDIAYVIFRLGSAGGDGDADGNGDVDAGDISFVIFRLGTSCAGP